MNLIQPIRNNILVGLLLLLPVVVALAIVNWLFTLTTDFIVQWLPASLQQSKGEKFLCQLLALAGLLIVLFLVGWMVRHMVGKRLYALGDRLLARVPVVNKVYVSVRQLSEAMLNQSPGMVKEVVLVAYPRPGVYTLGFITAAVPPGFAAPLGPDFVAVFIPASPLPTSGWVVVVRRAELIPLDISTAEAMKLVLSGGAVFPGAGGAPSSLLDRAEDWVERRRALDVAAGRPAAGGLPPPAV